MDDTRNPLGVATMVFEDYFFLQRWYDYFAGQVGAENLFIFSHGNDDRHRQIARGANVINVPRDPSMTMFDRRRWAMLSHYVSGMLRFYNWMILVDVDEFVIVDPDVSPDLISHLRDRYAGEDAPVNIAPLCLELVHDPDHETDPMEPGTPILSRRRTFRPNRNYSKPCLVAKPAKFASGGHRNDLGPRHLPDDLYMVHLKYFDVPTMQQRGQEKQAAILGAEALNKNFAKMTSWYEPLKSHDKILSSSTRAGEDIRLPEFRAALLQQKARHGGRYEWGPAKTDKLYRIPDRFARLF